MTNARGGEDHGQGEGREEEGREGLLTKQAGPEEAFAGPASPTTLNELFEQEYSMPRPAVLQERVTELQQGPASPAARYDALVVELRESWSAMSEEERRERRSPTFLECAWCGTALPSVLVGKGHVLMCEKAPWREEVVKANRLSQSFERRALAAEEALAAADHRARIATGLAEVRQEELLELGAQLATSRTEIADHRTAEASAWQDRAELASELEEERAARAKAEEANATLVAALDQVQAALQGLAAVAWPTTEEGHTGFVDRLGMQFYRETGTWPHFKSAPMEMRHEPSEDDRRAWGAWLERKRFAAADAAARALGTTRESDHG